MNLIFQKEYNQDKDNLELLKDVKVKLIINIMQLNILNNLKELLILVNYKQDKQLIKQKIFNMLLNNMIFIFEIEKDNLIILNLI